MNKTTVKLNMLLIMIFLFSGCGPLGNKTTRLSVIYGTTAILSLILLAGYCAFVRKKDIWFLLLFGSVFIVNIGYFSLSISKSIEEALLANRISYLGSVFLPMSILMVILGVTKLKFKKWLPVLLLIIGAVVFFIAASPGYLDIYYKEVSLTTINGVTVLQKVYGPWHCIYLFYLISYFAAMSGAVIHANHLKRLYSTAHAVILVAAVLVNIGVWLLEQLVRLDFEFLSISYIISELFLLGLYLMLQEQENHSPAFIEPPEETASTEPESGASQPDDPLLVEQCRFFAASLPELTPTERTIYDFYIAGASTKEVMQTLNIKENTLKYHNKNMYCKLGVKSRKELMLLAKNISLNANSEVFEIE